MVLRSCRLVFCRKDEKPTNTAEIRKLRTGASNIDPAHSTLSVVLRETDMHGNSWELPRTGSVRAALGRKCTQDPCLPRLLTPHSYVIV